MNINRKHTVMFLGKMCRKAGTKGLFGALGHGRVITGLGASL